MFAVDQVLRAVTPRRVWYTPRGAYGCAKRIVGRVPEDGRWVMITLTVDPARFPLGPADALESCLRDFPRVMRALARLNGGPLRWARKLELQANGWPHFHVICDLRKLSRDELPRIDAIWSHGCCNTSFIRGRAGLLYVLKYVSKGPESNEDADNYGLPDWLLDYPRKIRFWQTHNFYAHGTDSAKASSGTVHASASARPFLTIRQRISQKRKMLEVLVVSRDTHSVTARRIFSVDYSVHSMLLALVRRDHAPGLLISDELRGALNIQVKVKSCQTPVLPLLLLPGRVYVSLAA